jgi:branched-chain amino acid aminotransferase
MEVCFNGQFFLADAPLLPVQNQSYKWGDGVFETLKVFRGKLLLEELHIERLFSSLQLLGIEWSIQVTRENLAIKVLELCRRNNCLSSARIRLAVFRNDDNTAGYSIEAVPLEESVNQWQDDGLVITLYPYARKAWMLFPI